MRFFKLFATLVALTSVVQSQTLFEESLNKSSGTINVNQTPVKTIIKQKTTVDRLVSTNLESVIARGDIHFLYEAPQDNGWSTMVLFHVNPQGEFNKRTGDMGGAVGGRLYLEHGGKKSAVFLQGLAGFNHYSSWDLMIAVEIGQRLQWKKNIFLDVSLAVNRSYAASFKDPMAYIKANLTFTLNQRLLPFF